MRKCPRYIPAALLVLLAVISASLARGYSHGPAFTSYRPVEDWLRLPSGQQLGTISWIDFDSKGIAYVFRRCPVACDHPKAGDPPGVVWQFDSGGNFLGEWGQGIIAKEAHSLRTDRQGFIWITDTGAHQVKKFRPMARWP